MTINCNKNTIKFIYIKETVQLKEHKGNHPQPWFVFTGKKHATQKSAQATIYNLDLYLLVEQRHILRLAGHQEELKISSNPHLYVKTGEKLESVTNYSLGYTLETVRDTCTNNYWI